MKGLFIPEITAEMFRNGCLESIEALMAEGEIYDIEYDPKHKPERKKGRWIPCSERLPEKFRRVLCTIQDGEQLYVSLGAFIRHTDAPGNPDFSVVAWMPLPEEPYKEEE